MSGIQVSAQKRGGEGWGGGDRQVPFTATATESPI